MEDVGGRSSLALVGCTVLAVALAFRTLGERGMFSPAEARYSLVAVEMLESGDWIQPRLNHVRYDEKPPLLYWAIAASYRLLGVDDFAARVPSAAAYVGTGILTFGIAGELLGAAAAPIAALVYITSAGAFVFGRFVFTDTLLVFFTTLSLFGLCRIAGGRAGWGSVLAFHAGAALAGLTKGFIGLVFPFATAAIYGFAVGDGDFRRRLRPLVGAAVVGALFLPWHVALALRDPSFIHFYVVNEHLRRFLNVRVPTDYVGQSIPGFWLSTALWLLPWTLFAPQALVSALGVQRRVLALPLIWTACVIGFFTATPSRLEYYSLPAAPALAVIVAARWRRLERRGRSPARRNAIGPIFVATLAAGVLCIHSPPEIGRLLTAVVSDVDGYYREYFVAHPADTFALTDRVLGLAAPFAAVVLATASGAWMCARRGWSRGAFAVVTAGTVPCLLMVDFAMRMVAVDRSQRRFAAIVQNRWTDDAELVVVGPYEDRCGVTYYTRRPTKMLNAEGGDLLFGYRGGDARDLFLTADEFEREWSSARHVFVVSAKSYPLADATVLAESPRDLLRTNHAETLGGEPALVVRRVSKHAAVTP